MQPQIPQNGGYYPATPSSMDNGPWGQPSVYPQPVYGQQYMSHSTFPSPAHHHNVHFPSPPPSNGQLYTPSIYQGMAYGYAAPYMVDPGRSGPPASGTMGIPPIHPGQDSTYYWYPSIGESVEDRH